MSNLEFYDRHVTRSEVDQAIGIQRIEPCLLEYMKNQRPKLKGPARCVASNTAHRILANCIESMAPVLTLIYLSIHYMY